MHYLTQLQATVTFAVAPVFTMLRSQVGQIGSEVICKVPI
jgi:hypothetical protein